MGAPHIEKKCGDCQEIKPVSEFYKSGRGRDGYCKACRRRRDRKRDAKKWNEKTRDARRNYKLRHMYGITLDDYNAMAERQNHACALCGGKETRSAYGERPRLVVDHNHVTGKVRALLCAACNGRLASIENEQFMLLAKEYIRTHDGFEFVGDPD